MRLLCSVKGEQVFYHVIILYRLRSGALTISFYFRFHTMRNFFISAVILLLGVSQASFSQPLTLGQWKTELPYRNAVGVTASNNKIYCATELTVYSVDKADNSMEELTTVTGLSDIQSNIVAFDKSHNLLVICYLNSNIDILKDGQVINISDIKRKSIVGDKSIYSVFFYGDYAYLCCGFGIVLLDIVKFEIKDTYYIGVNGANLQVNDLTCDGTYLYAATVSGILRGQLNDPTLVDFRSWYTFLPVDGLTLSNYASIAYFNGLVYASKGDTLFKQQGGVWAPYLVRNGFPIRNMEPGASKLVMSQIGSSGTRVMTLNTSGALDSIYSGQPYQAIEDDDAIWIADLYEGLKKFANGYAQILYPNGPSTSGVFDLAVNSTSNNLYIAPGGYNASYGFIYNRSGFFVRIDDEWSSYDINNTPILKDSFDIVCVTVNPADNHAYFGSLWLGMFEFDDSLGIVNQYTPENSSLTGTNGDYARVKVTDIAFDRYNNLWAANFGSLSPICVREADGTWLNFEPTFPIDQQWVLQMTFDQYNQTWFVLPRQGIMVFNYGTSLKDKSDDKYKKLVTGPGSGNLPSQGVNCVTTDKDGNIWVGTDQGVTVFYCPGDVFSEIPCDAQQIVITAADGYNGYLLGTENVKRIVIDGANRKWFGTDNGVWLFSEDGTEEILHFTTENSPLLSDFITALDIDNTTGEVYIGTEKGIMVYRSDATGGSTKSCEPTVFPNPVRENYTGPIAISHVVNNAEVKITDAQGNLIYRTQALGGQVIWDGNNYNGERAKTGVYLVLASNSDGSVTCVAKLLMVN
ncbi:MAG: FlgD immunoglobulin-like domain containing protein [Chitinophagales bacterium]